ncbi:DNA internalization-related competence protein ComEC/Rec2 [Phocoenobacter skyensis]|uniref:Competence protein ComEC n=1 Tax=Phocoenobacter skyensis TaxID=97481 RepID=A0A1H7XQB2_9PAST|nr:DNA internalization-related competence protein ComEC/Rec2 [Pasteurella skyensis]MDP8080087.1 DNA internalization-related competence protein ComEC/Rec2 [Pasteurella skyensis]MDP8086065.1 DNA internalization-related competence protein ComEC/Rec2 [Pasteurella skyensis]MDP8185771.1 DNA internalization-related competence protein ComEC/Rec2 [Pasteurella skyensis]QLB22658.1 DNA internalization-related competence protein ComEC/Rec2 [Pasteurella skyensis]SEM35398.1 competence protein ComEC [Pasteure
MNLDKFCILFVLLQVVLLWLPLDYFSIIIVMSVIVAVVMLWHKKRLWGLLGLVIAMSFYNVQQIAKNAENVTATTVTKPLKIVKILHQQDYKTAIGELYNGKRLYLQWRNNIPLKLEQHYQATLKIRPISGRLNQGNFNRQQWYFANKMNGIAIVKRAKLIDKKSMFDFSIRTKWLNHTKTQTQHLATQGLILALGFGERAWLTASHWHIFKQTTTAHLIAISGLHIGLVTWLGFWFAKLLQYIILSILSKTSGYIGKNFCKKCVLSYRLPLLLGLFSAVAYSFLANFSIPTLRALLAISLILICQLARRHYTAMQLWWRIVAVLLFCYPITLLSSSFWLSILAVWCLIIWYRYFPLKQIIDNLSFKSNTTNNPFVRFIIAILHLQLGILLLFTPIQFYFFEGTSFFAFIANLVIVPFYSLLVVPLILFSLITNNLLNTWHLVDYLLQMSLALLNPLANDWIILSQYQQWQILTLNLLILMVLYAWLNHKLKLFWKYIGLNTIIFNSLFYIYFFTQPKTQWITFDVGQGLANAFIYREGLRTQAVLYDTGVSWGKGKTKNSMAKLEILPYLKRNGIDVKGIFLSHDDKDHSGGIVDILNEYPKARLISSSYRQYAHRKAETCVQGKQWQFGDFRLQSYYPIAVTLRAKNANSCVILVTIKKFKILLTGDITYSKEPDFAPQIGKIDFLQVPHHGSKTSTSQLLLSNTMPKFAMVSTGRWNMWHLPNKKVIKRLKDNQIKVLNTAKEGMITVNFDDKSYKIQVARGQWSAWYSKIF